MGTEKHVSIPWMRISMQLSALLSKIDFFSAEERHKILKAWRHCEKHGHINGFEAPKEIRQLVGDVADAINLRIDPGQRIEARKEVGKTLNSKIQ